MKKLFALLAFIAFVSVNSASAQSAAPAEDAKSTVTSTTEEVKADVKEKSCHGSTASKASCCKNKSRAEASNHRKKDACCAKHDGEKAKLKREKAKDVKTL